MALTISYLKIHVSRIFVSLMNSLVEILQDSQMCSIITVSSSIYLSVCLCVHSLAVSETHGIFVSNFAYLHVYISTFSSPPSSGL